MLADPEVRAACDALAAEFDLARDPVAARVRAGLTQAEVAARTGRNAIGTYAAGSGAQMPEREHSAEIRPGNAVAANHQAPRRVDAASPLGPRENNLKPLLL